MAKFLSTDWIKLYQEQWNNDRVVTDGLRKISATMKYYVEGAEGDAVFVRLDHGRAVEVGPDDGRKYDYVMWATLEDWKDLAAGKVGPKKAMALRKLKFKGSMLTAMRHLTPFGRSLEMMSEVDTQW